MEELATEAVRDAWRANKRQLAGGGCVYMCAYRHSDSARCRRAVELQDPVRNRRYAASAEWLAAAGWETCRSIGGPEPWRYCWQHRFRGPQTADGLRN